MLKPLRCRSIMTEAIPMQRIRLADDYEISRVIRGGWQMADGHGELRGDDPVGDMVAFADAGITTFDCADIYTGVEELIGRFRLAYRDPRGEDALKRIKVHTKFVPDRNVLPSITLSYVEGIIDQSLRRLHLDRLDLVQFHWWDYSVARWQETAHWLDELRRAGKIHKVSATNFDTDHMLELVKGGVPLTSMQVQYSLLDARPGKRLAQAAADNGVWLLCYGTVAGGFLGDGWLGRPEPAEPLENRSLTKYKLIIDDLGGWDLFQALLQTLRGIADAHQVDIATVASAAVLTRPRVAAVIVGARTRAHLAANLAISSLHLTPADHQRIEAVLADARPLEGDVYGLERGSRHGAVMKYNLNQGVA
jgi:aryl-alcohol dehydrogenase-like predicted oxidoreductase